MYSDSRIAIGTSAKPSSFASLMSLYESNFVRLNWLIQEPETFTGEQQSIVAGDCVLHLKLLERTRHTSTLHMTYMFEESGCWVADPDMTIRIYHDARLAEAMACSSIHRHEILRQFATGCDREVSRRRARNSMLNKWLEYCAETGHQFVTIRSTSGPSDSPG